MARPIIAVIGIGTLDREDPIYRTGVELGQALIDNGYRLVTGGLGGIMEAVSKGAHLSERYREGDVVGILPGTDRNDANDFIDIPIPTGLGIGRNMIVTNADAVIALGGGSGTLSEIAFAWQKGKLVIAFDVEGWSGKVAGERLDDRVRVPDVPDDRIYGVSNVEKAMDILNEKLELYL